MGAIIPSMCSAAQRHYIALRLSLDEINTARYVSYRERVMTAIPGDK